MNVTFRTARREDTPLLLSFINELASYENMLDQVVATEELLGVWLFDQQRAEAFFAVKDGLEIGFALFFYNFSTFLGRAGIYLEDLYVKPEHRGQGIGKAIFRELANIALQRKCGRLEWACLDWNKPSIAFYLALGAQVMDEWTVYRLSGDSLNRLVGR